MAFSKFEHRVTVPTGGWSMDFTDSGGTSTVTVPAGTYYWSSAGSESNDLPAELAAQLNADATLAGTYTVTISAGSFGTGKVTIASSVDFTAEWNVSALRLLFGFDGDLDTVSTDSFVSDNHVEGLWLPQAPVETPYGLGSSGRPRSAAHVSVSPGGHMTAYHGPKHTRNEYRYAAVVATKVIQAQETTAGESYESFWLDGIRGEATWATSGRSLRFYASADTDATYLTHHVINQTEPEIDRVDPAWDGLWSVVLRTVGAD